VIPVAGTPLDRLQRYLLEPAPTEKQGGAGIPASAGRETGSIGLDSVSALVLGLSGRCGGTTVARGLAATLAVAGARAAHVVALAGTGEEPAPLRGALSGGGRQWDVPPGLATAEEVAEYGATITGLTGAPGVWVWDVPATAGERAVVAARAVGSVVVVAAGEGEPALAELAADMLRERWGPLMLVANRVREPNPWADRAAVALPQSRLGALLAVRGRRPPGPLGAGLAELAALVEQQCGLARSAAT
jgi:hypothetical protein